MTSDIVTATELPVGHVFEIAFDAFQPRLTILSDNQLRIEILGGMSAGMVEVVDYTASNLRPGLFVISWQEESRMTIVHVEDFAEGLSRAHVTLPDSTFMRFTGQISHSD
jgi:hypothetical protein